MSEGSDPSAVRVEYRLVDNRFARIDGILRSRGPKRSRTVVLHTHPRLTSDQNLNEWPSSSLPALGFDTFFFNNRATNSTAGTEVATLWEDLALDVAAAVEEMRGEGYERVVLYGYSAGGPLVAYYQNVAENGNAAFNRGALSRFAGFHRGGEELRLPPADALVTQNGTSGTGNSFLARLDGSVIDEESGTRDPRLDPFDPANGYDPATGHAAYSAEFLGRYFAAQGTRMNRLIASAQARLEDVERSASRFTDDDIIVIPGIRAEPASIDLRLAARTAEPRLLEPGGRLEVVSSVRRVVPSYARRNHAFRDGGTVHTLRSFLSYRAIRVDPEGYDPDAVTPETWGADESSSHSTTAGNIAGVTVPLLVTAGTADTQVHLPHAELMCNAARRTADRRVVCIEGAEHDMTPIDPRYGDTRAAHLRVVSDWLAERFPVG